MFELTPEVEQLLSKAYVPQLTHLVQVFADGLPAGQDIFYRVRFENLDESGIAGEAQLGRFRTAPAGHTSTANRDLCPWGRRSSPPDHAQRMPLQQRGGTV